MVDFKSTCEACGADLPEPDAKGFVRCNSCGRVTQVSVAPPPPVAGPGDIEVDSAGFHISIKEGATGTTTPFGMPGVTIGAPTTTGSQVPFGTITTKTSAGTKAGCVIGILCALIGPVIAIIAIVSANHATKHVFGNLGNVGGGGSSFAQSIEMDGSVRQLAPTGAGGGDLLAVIQDESGGGSNRYLSRFKVGPTAMTQVWRGTPVLPTDTAGVAIAQSGNVIFAGVGNTLWAVSASTGKQLWTAPLSDKVDDNCDRCVAVVQGIVVVRTDDAYLTAFRPTGAEPLWHQRLVSQSALAQVLGNRLLVLDNGPNPGDQSAVRTLDPATGHVLSSFTPECTSADGSQTFVAGSGIPIYAVPGTGDLVVAFAEGDGCVVRWNGATNAVVWKALLQGAGSIPDGGVVVSAQDMVVATESNGMAAIQMDNGSAKLLPASPDYSSLPNRIVGRVLIADTKTSRGTTKGGLEAWGLGSGKRLWSIDAPQGAQQTSAHSSDALFTGSPRYVLAVTGSTARLLVFQSDTANHTYTDQVLDLTTGLLGADKGGTYKYPDPGTPSMTVEGIASGHLLISVDTLLEAIPLGGGPILT